MTELEAKIMEIRIKRTLKNISKNQIGFVDVVRIVQWQLRDKGKFSVAESQLMIGLQTKYN